MFEYYYFVVEYYIKYYIMYYFLTYSLFKLPGVIPYVFFNIFDKVIIIAVSGVAIYLFQ